MSAGHSTATRLAGYFDAGGHRMAGRHPYWDRWGVTFEDPDGYRLVLSRS
ncbi:MAG: hypothetical protein ACYCO3_04340 [Mycobacteriales bacterium]